LKAGTIEIEEQFKTPFYRAVPVPPCVRCEARTASRQADAGLLSAVVAALYRIDVPVLETDGTATRHIRRWTFETVGTCLLWTPAAGPGAQFTTEVRDAGWRLRSAVRRHETRRRGRHGGLLLL